MHILFVTSEVAGVFKLGGLADVSLSLPLALGRRGIKVTVCLPFYKTIDSVGVKGVGELAVDFDGVREFVFLFSKPLGVPGVELLLFRHPRLNEYQGSSITETFAFYAKAISAYYSTGAHLTREPIDIVHCHDWHTALVPLLIGENNKLKAHAPTIQSKQAGTIITIHNLLYQGVEEESIADSLNAPRELLHTMGSGHKTTISFLREGLEYADVVTTVSPTYAKEIVGMHDTGHLGNVLQKRKADVIGILNGIDEWIWDPTRDSALPGMYGPSTVFDVKPQNKAKLVHELRLTQTRVPLFGFVGRLEPRQKGIDILIASLKELLPRNLFQMVLLGTGDKESVEELKALSTKYSDSLIIVDRFDDLLAHRIYSGADVLLVPSKFEPCGLTQMIAMRYGTVPLVRQTGGLADSVVDGQTGFFFKNYTSSALTECMLRVIGIWEKDQKLWGDIMKRAMKADFSWEKSAKEYIQLYTRVIKSRK